MVVVISEAQKEPKSFVAGTRPQNTIETSQNALGMADILQWQGKELFPASILWPHWFITITFRIPV